MIIFTGNISFSKKIALRSDGLKASCYTNGPESWISLWTKESDLKTTKISIALSAPCIEFTDKNNLVIASPGPANYGNGPIIVSELDLSGNTLNQFNLGDNYSRWGASCKLKSGGCLFVNCRDLSALGDTQIHLDFAYLPFSSPSIPNGQSTWIKKSFTLTHILGPMLPCDMSLIEGPDGLVWLFFTSDSTGAVACARFNLAGNMITLVDYDESFIGRTSNGQPLDYSINGEVPLIIVMPDFSNGRLLLVYQDAHHQWTPCDPHIISQNLVVCAAYPDKHKELITLFPWASAHEPQPYTYIFPRPDGIYFIAPYFEVNVCSGGWKTGLYDNKTVRVVTTDQTNGRFRSYSEDGWTLFERPISDVQNEYDLMQYKFRPKLSCGKAGNNLVVKWDFPTSKDQLQVSNDLKAWSNYGVYPAITPVSIPMTASKQFFRLKQNMV